MKKRYGQQKANNSRPEPSGLSRRKVHSRADGEFRSGHNMNPIGRPNFSFAGSAYREFNQLADAMEDNRRSVQPELKQKDGAEAGTQSTTLETRSGGREVQQNFKGVDFLSRLHGHIDISAFSPEQGQ